MGWGLFLVGRWAHWSILSPELFREFVLALRWQLLGVEEILENRQEHIL